MISLQMALIAGWVCADLGAFCLLHLALATKLTWDMKSSAVVAPLHDSLMYKDDRNSQASGKDKKNKKQNKTRSFIKFWP